ncbi:MAG: hypothetical protein U9Q73_01755 [Nanoarchaeota archaeon]|nr:hypothetical protein [Nanoarchaeota archaeon]
MCDKKSYCNRKVDDCLVDIVNKINSNPNYRTLACCCGHGIYPTTIVVKDKKGHIFEWFTKIWLGKRKRNRYYKSDSEGFYFIPEVIENFIRSAEVLERL